MPNSYEELSQSDALEAAHDAATIYHYSPLIKLELLPDKGADSLTFAASYDDSTEGIIQLRDRPISIEMVYLAHTLLGSIVPIVVQLNGTKTSHAYGQPKIQGDGWFPMQWAPVEDDTAISVQLANILTRCNLHLDSGLVFNSYVIPRLDSVINLVAAAAGPFKDLPEDVYITCLDRLKNLRKQANNLKALDLILCHTDLNPSNISFDISAI